MLKNKQGLSPTVQEHTQLSWHLVFMQLLYAHCFNPTHSHLIVTLSVRNFISIETTPWPASRATNAVLAVVGAHSHTLQQLWGTCAHTQAAPYLWTAKFVVRLHVKKQLLSKLIWLCISCTACLVAATVFPLGCWCGRNRAGEQGWLLQFKLNQWTLYSRWNVSEIHWKMRRNESLGPWIYAFIL